MLRTRKPIILAIITLVVAGCAQSDRAPGSAHYPKFRSAKKSRTYKARPQQPPKILPQTHFAAGTLFESQGRIGKAIEQYRKAIAVNHNYVAAYHRLGRTLSMFGRHTEAADVLSHAVELEPDSAVLRNNYGYELMFERRWEQAERELRRAIALKPELDRAHINLGLVLSRAGRFDEALASFRAVLPEADAYYNLGLMFRGQGRDEQAAQAFRHVLSVNEDFSAAETQLAQIAERLEPTLPPETVARAEQPEPTPVAEPTTIATRIPATPESAAPAKLASDERTTLDDIFEGVDDMVTSKIIESPTMTETTTQTDVVETPEKDALAGFLTHLEMLRETGSEQTAPADEPRPITDITDQPATTEVARRDTVNTKPIADSAPIPPKHDPLIEWDGAMVDVPTLVEILDNETRCFEQMEVVRQPETVAETPTTHATKITPEKAVTTQIALRTDDEPGIDIDIAQADTDIIETGIADRVEKLTERVRSFDTAAALTELEAKLAIVRNEIECLEEEWLQEPTVTRTTRPTMSATVITLMGPPAELAPTPEELAAANFARIQRKPTRPTATTDWRTSFSELDVLLSITRNEVLCRRDLGAEGEETLATITPAKRRNTGPSRNENLGTTPPPASRTFGFPAPQPQPQR